MLQSTKGLYKTVKAAHGEIFTQASACANQITRETKLEEFCDFAYAMKKVVELLEDLTSEMRKKLSLTEILVCNLAVKEMRMGAIETEYCTATPKPKVGISLPGFKK